MALHDDILELLQANGPMEVEFIRIRLCIASQARLEAALFVLQHEGRIERVNARGGATAYRLPGDAREPGPGDIHLQSKLRSRARKAA